MNMKWEWVLLIDFPKSIYLLGPELSFKRAVIYLIYKIDLSKSFSGKPVKKSYVYGGFFKITIPITDT